MEYQPKGSQIDADGLHDFMKEQIDRLTEENKKLRKELDEEKVASLNFYQEADEELKEGIKQLTQENKKLKKRIEEDHKEVPSFLIKDLYLDSAEENKKLRKQIDDYWKVDDEIGGFVDGKFPDIASHLRKCWEDKERIRKLYCKANKERNELKEENLNLEKENNTRKDIIYNLFSKLLKNEDVLDDGIDISKEYGQKYIDEWNEIHKEIFEDVVETMNKCEFDEDVFHIEYNGDTHFDICHNIVSSDEEDNN